MKKVKKRSGLWRRIMAGIGALLMVISVVPWTLWAKTESVTSIRAKDGYTAVNWEKAAFLPGDNYQVLNMELHTTNEGNIAYCLQQNVGNPTDTKLSYEETAADTFSKESLESVKQVLLNGYPMNQEMWKHIPAQGQREATQIAVWYLMSHFSQEGSGANGSASSFSTILDKDCIKNSKEYDVVGMARTLVQCGLTGEALYDQRLEFTETSVTERDGKFEVVYESSSEGIGRITGTIHGVKGEFSLTIEGETVPCEAGTFSWDCSGKMPERMKLTMDAFDNKEGTVSVTLEGTDIRNLPSIFFLRADGAYQKMMGTRLQEQIVVSETCTTTLPGYVPPDTKIRIVKKDAESGEAIAGAGFQVFRKSDNRLMALKEGGETIMYTEEDGSLTTMPLPYDEYVVVEKEAPAGYLTAEPQTVTFSGRGEEMVTVTVYDQLYRVSLNVQKKDSVTGTDICQAGVVYRLLDKEKNELDLGGGSDFITDEEGRLEVPYELSSGIYYLRERKAPSGYCKSSEDVKVEISCGQVVVTQEGRKNHAVITERIEDGRYHYLAEFAVEDDPIILEVAKKHPFGESSLIGAMLLLTAKEEIYGPDGTLLYRAGDEVRRWESEMDAEFFYAIPAGCYELSEEEAPLGYEVTESILVEVKETPEPQLAVLANSPQRYSLQVTKTGELGESLQGVEFKLQYGADVYGEEEEPVFRKGQLVLDETGAPVTLITGEDGCASTEGLYGWLYDEEGDAVEELTYQLLEVKTANGYVLSEEPYLLTEEGWTEEQEVLEVVLANPLQKGRILVKKTGLEPRYETGYSTEYGKVYSEERTQVPLSGAGFTLYEDAECQIPLEVITTGADGIATSSLWPVGTYYVRETVTPAGYLPEDSIYSCEIVGDDTGAELVEDCELNVTNEPCEVTISFVKQGRARNIDHEWEHFLLRGAVFGLYRQGKLIEYVVSSEEGEVLFNGHYPAGEYEIWEIQSPEGFGGMETPVKISVKPEHQKLVIKLDQALFLNGAVRGKLTLEKVDGADQPLGGVEFTLTNRETGEKLVEKTNKEGLITWENIPAGYQGETGEFVYYHYDLTETGVPEGYRGMHEAKEVIFDQENRNQQVVAIRTRIVNYEESLPVILGTKKLPPEVSLGMIALGALAGVLHYHIKKRWKK